MKQFVFIICCLLLLTSCKKDTKIGVEPKSDCEPFPDTGPLGYNPTKSRDNSLNRYNGIYDPINPNYFYYLIDQNPGLMQVKGILVRLNLTTGEKLRLDSNIIVTPYLNKTGWFAYRKGDLNIYKIKTNGDSLTKLTLNGGGDLSGWSYNDKYIFITGGSGTLKINASNLHVDTLDISVGLSSRISNKVICGRWNNNLTEIYLKNLDDNSEKSIYINVPKHNFALIDNTDTFLFLFGLNDVYRIEIATGKLEKILPSCFSREYARPTFNFHKNKIVASRIDRTLMDDKKTIYYEINLYEISLDGKQVTKLELPN